MRIFSMIAALASWMMVTTSGAGAAGFTLIDIPAADGKPALRGAVWYPCPTQTPREIKFGPASVRGAQDCPLTGERLPLVVISHGVGGWFGGHHDTAEAAADGGFIVATINHPLDSGQSKIRRPGDIASMIERPRDIKRLIDYMLTNWSETVRIDRERVGFFGFSRGGYTGLVAIGGVPDFRLLLDNCPTYPGNHWCEQIRDGSALNQPFIHDRRIKAAIIADPALGSQFTAAGLKDVKIPVQLWASERGGDGVTPKDTATVAQNLPAKPDYRIAANTGHFAFLAPCTAEFAKAAADFGEAEICEDAGGFDRKAFHDELNAAVVQFFRAHLADLTSE